MIEKFTALTANSFMKILNSKTKKEKSGWVNHTAFDVGEGHGRLEQFELALEELGGDVFRDHALMFFFGHSLQILITPLARLDVHVGHPFAVAVLDADEPLAPETRTSHIEVETAFVRDLDGLNRSREDLMVRAMFTSKPVESTNDFVRDRGQTSFSQLGFECRLECFILCKTHASLLSCLCWNVLSATAMVTGYRQTMIPIISKVIILRHKSQETASAASWEYLKNFSFLLLQNMVSSFAEASDGHSEPILRQAQDKLFFSGFFCGLERCGSAAFPNFREGTSSPPQAAKIIRTIPRINHILEKRESEKAISLPKNRKVLYWCGFTTPLETILAKILEQVQFAPPRRQPSSSDFDFFCETIQKKAAHRNAFAIR